MSFLCAREASQTKVLAKSLVRLLEPQTRLYFPKSDLAVLAVTRTSALGPESRRGRWGQPLEGGPSDVVSAFYAFAFPV
jgi:hypothetical protein